MAVFSEMDLLALMRVQNPWWQTGKTDERKDLQFHRGEYYVCEQTFWHTLRRFPVLIGPRRVGKSTIAYQMIGNLLRSGIDPYRILYLSLDTSALEDAGILRLLMLYRSQISQAEDFYLFVDEVQKDEDWTSVLKYIYDAFPSARALATGSASFRIEGKTRETGEGRLRPIRIPTLSFYEYCMMKGLDAQEVKVEDVFQLHQATLAEQSTIMTKLACFEPELNRYLRLGGFPEYVSVSQADESYALSLIEENVINKAVYHDLTTTENVNPTQMKHLFSYLCNTTSNLVNVEEICREMRGISNATVAKYIEILESAGLIYRAEQMNSAGKKILKARSKIHIADSGIREAVMSELHSPDDPVQKGYLVESTAYKHTVDYCRCEDPHLKVGYMIQPGKDREIDIVICDQSGIRQLVESKVRNQSAIRDSDLIITAALPHQPGYVITKSSTDYGLSKRENTTIYRIPAVTYLFLLGQMKYSKNRMAYQAPALDGEAPKGNA